MVFERATEYKVIIPTAEDMVAHLAKPDRKDRRDGKSPLVPCDQCILDLPLDRGEVA